MKKAVEHINGLISVLKKEDGFDQKRISDGYHDFGELYQFRMTYHALIANEWARLMKQDEIENGGVNNMGYDVHKSLRHHDGEYCFGGGYFVVAAMTPHGLVSNHYKLEYWDLFKIPVTEREKYEFDGHTGKDVLERLSKLL